jgi:hypothetical protein
MQIRSSWEVIGELEDRFGQFVPRLVEGEGEYFFCVQRASRNHRLMMLWVDRVVGKPGSEVCFTKGLMLWWLDFVRAGKHRAVAALVIEELRKREWLEVGLYDCLADPDVFEVPAVVEV